MKLTRRAFLAVGATLALSACGGSGDSSPGEAPEEVTEEPAEEAGTEEQTEQEQKPLDFDATGREEVGDLNFFLSTSAGTTENGNIPKVVMDPDTIMYDLVVCAYDGDGTVCNVYYDGYHRARMNAYNNSETIVLEGKDLAEGIHAVALVSDEDNGASILRIAQFEITY